MLGANRGCSAAAGVIALLLPAPAAGNESELKARLEGRLVEALIDMPATPEGVDVYPGRSEPVDRRSHGARLSRAGAGVRRGDRVVVSRVELGRRHIEIWLGSGGDDRRPDYRPPRLPYSRRQHMVREELRHARSELDRQRLQQEWQALEDERERREHRRKDDYERLYQSWNAERSDEEWALLAGSRINLRFDGPVPDEYLTVEGLAKALAKYLALPSAQD